MRLTEEEMKKLVNERGKQIEAYIKEKKLYGGLRVATLLGGAPKEAINSLVEAAIKEGDLLVAREAAKLIGRNLSGEEIDSLLKTCIQAGFLADAQEVAKLKERDLSQEEIDSLLKACIREGRATDAKKAARLIGREFSTEEIDYLVRVAIEKWGSSEALEAAKMGTSTKVIDLLVKAYIDDGIIMETAEEVAKLRGRKLSTDEIKKLEQNMARLSPIHLH